LLLVTKLVNLNTILQSTAAPHLLMVFCETNQLLNVETKQIFESVFNSLKKNQSGKLNLNTQSENGTVTLLHDIAKEELIMDLLQEAIS
jgi:hypothetical protein